jgi:hypothetical protein
MEMFAMSVTGKTAKVTLSTNGPNPKDALRAQGFTDADLQHLMLSPKPFAPPRPPGVAAAPPKPLALETFPVPRPKTPDDVMPKTSDDKVISSNWFFPWVRADLDDDYYFSGESDINGDLKPPLYCKMDYRLFWVNEYSETLTGPVEYDKTVKVTKGQSETDTHQLSAEVGVKVGDLSAKLSETTTHSVTISSSVENDETFHLKVDAGKIAVWTLWHLAEAFVIVDAGGNPVKYSGDLALFGVGFVTTSVTLPQNRFVNLRSDFRPDMVVFDDH